MAALIAYGVCIGSEDKYQAFARPGIRAHAAPDSPLAESRHNHSIFTAYNEILAYFSGETTLEALVLLHEDLQIRDPRFEDKVRAVFEDPEVAIAGAIGGCNVPGLAWWEGEGHGYCSETRGVADFGRGNHDVDVVDGLLLILSPWAVRELRFDDTAFRGFHGYDADICFQAREAGRRVRVFDVDVFHHTKGGYGDVESYQAAEQAFQGKWAGRLARRALNTT